MKQLRKYYIIFITSSLLISCAAEKKTTTATSKATSESAKKQMSQQLVMGVLWYQKSAEMVAAYQQAYKYAEMLLDSKLKTVRSSLPLAVVLDIDETVLDNSPYEGQLIEKGKIYQPSTWKAWTSEARAKALPGALEFVNFAKKKGLEIFYISNRDTDELDATIENLKKYRFPDADTKHVILKSSTSDKTERREKVANSHTILVFVGDNLTDYSELYADRGNDMGKELVKKNKSELLYNFVILPNPMYGEWEGAIYNNDYSIDNESKVQKRLQAIDK
ncbi:5'-nucleotidase, lipoprotein e(P4) family [Fulvivirga sp. 29W222]|uniref:5'-nucleotidase, lipoprotein e(P4) family n=1 Tax=Fulvivirga marina TaxID=2494733 RepID=A0A937FY50_9BACT|nr:5'-nucleotidase, lipoprotein e(P4) family [Fulvivirga marina]MBL6447142.1 5'-nucleotidase, lipoprotein e(P4) family [Fulvivirga marina]